MNVVKLIEDNGLKLHGDIEHFAELVRADEREACAVLCETECAQNDGITCAEAIRERGEK